MTTHSPDSWLTDLLSQAWQLQASDLHLVCGYPPACRVHGQIRSMGDAPLIQDRLYHQLIPLLPDPLRQKFIDEHNADFSFELTIDQKKHRFRANYFLALRNIGATIRLIPDAIPSFDWAGFPPALASRILQFHNGLVLLTGVTGSGKTTSLAMMVNQMLQQGGIRIVTIEEPVEYIFPQNSQSIVSQREVGLDVASFGDGLKYALRQDPDVILVGEIRDRETAQMALSAAETGHLVLSTMHTRDAKGALTRLLDLFPPDAQNDIRTQLALSLRSVVSQHLVPSLKPSSKRELSLEVLFNTLPVASSIRLGKIEAIDNAIQTGKSDGMITLDDSLKILVQAQRISPQSARAIANDPRHFAVSA